MATSPPAGADGSPRRAASAADKALEKLGLVRDIDLALHLPLRYEDETRVVPIASLHDGEVGQIEGVVTTSRIQFRPRRQLVVTLQDESGDLVLRFLHFYPSQQKSFAEGRRMRVRGEARGGFFGLEMVHPSFKAADTALPTALTPVYPSTVQLSQAVLRKAVAAGLARADLEEILPAGSTPAHLPTLREALLRLHQPVPGLEAQVLEDRSHPAWHRLKFDELLAQQLSQLRAKREREQQRAPAFAAPRSGLHDALLAALPFQLTAAQHRVAEEIARDLGRGVPMHRLLQGDVGSGKTVVAALAATVVIGAGWQCALMAPTEILAEQHLKKLVGWLSPLGITVAWLTGSRKGKARTKMLAQVESGEAALVVGTHAVIEDQVRFARLGLAIIDEQHRFGVTQRLALRAKLGESNAQGEALEPHMLMMSATPIPRTLAMTLFADLDVSTIDSLPPGRTPIETRLFADAKRDEVIARIGDEIARGRQVYWVCPLVEASAVLDLQNATAAHAQLCAAFPGHMIGLLHGRMSAAEKTAVMALFASGQIAVLVATTVIEVGVDVANASLMVVEHAERFGLSQLHQLRGRVGRGTTASICVLLYSAPLSDTAKARLKALLETGDGFEIARRDLEIRGPGELLGARQSGAALLRFADPVADEEILLEARRVADRLLDVDPEAAARHVERWLGGRSNYLNA
ncbi:MAG: ATP-dependent DNA helicase RecG [Pseudomonadota bacterium]|nr:ATP-dependent DNA helicase RecG [Pseudomonadota bacterium]